MILALSDVITKDAARKIRTQLKSVVWKDGARTAGQTASAVKHNQQADLSSRTGARIRDELLNAVQTHPVLQAAAQPARFSAPLLSRTEPGGGYGLHFDNPFMGEGKVQMRTDLSFTLFLSDPDEYQGGALEIDAAGEQRRFRPPIGTLVLYPSSTLHRVTTVESGHRIAFIGWIESRVRHASQREILFDLENLRATLSAERDAQSDVLLSLGKTIANLKREFS